jgi:hypothetical protein
MSYAYLVSPMSEGADFQVDEDLMFRSLQETWIGIEIQQQVPNSTYALRWEAQIRGGTVLGGLQGNRQAISIETSDKTVVAEFAVWYRSLIPDKHRLFLYKGPTWQHPIELFPGTSVEKVVHELNRR